jgi:hypothetical protein
MEVSVQIYLPAVFTCRNKSQLSLAKKIGEPQICLDVTTKAIIPAPKYRHQFYRISYSSKLGNNADKITNV